MKWNANNKKKNKIKCKRKKRNTHTILHKNKLGYPMHYMNAKEPSFFPTPNHIYIYIYRCMVLAHEWISSWMKNFIKFLIVWIDKTNIKLSMLTILLKWWHIYMCIRILCSNWNFCFVVLFNWHTLNEHIGVKHLGGLLLKKCLQ